MYIAKSDGLSLWVPDGSWYSFYNSPYIGHREGTAVDVYYKDKPVYPFENGLVMGIKKIRTPRNIPVDTDFLTIIKINDEVCLKVLHVKPSVQVGEKLYVGDEFGSLILSGFFMLWSDKHAHFEIREVVDCYRARGGFPIEPTIIKNVPTILGNEFETAQKKDHYYWLKPLKTRGKNLTPLTFDGAPIEGGLPHYRYGAIFENKRHISILDKRLSSMYYLQGRVGIFGTSFKMFANNQSVKGIGVYCNQEKIKLIGGKFELGEIIEIKLN